MKKLNTILTSLAVLGTLGAFAGCTTEDTTGPGTTTVVAPSGLMALSKNSSTISLKWTRDATDASTDTIMISGGNSINNPIAVASPNNTVDITNLAPQIEYTFTVRNSAGSSNSVKWMTANRTATGLKIYQFASSNTSGLDLKDGTSISASAANAGSLDFVLDDSDDNSQITGPSGLSLVSASNIQGTWRASFVSAVAQRYVVGGLDADYSSTDFSADLADMLNNRGTAHPIEDDGSNYNTKGHRVLLVGTADGNLAKIDIVPDPTTGKLYSGTSPNKYITVNVSYQPKVGAPYAARAHSHIGQKTPYIPVF